MQFKIDENMPVEAATVLNEAGHDALTVHDQRMVGEADAQVASVCKLEQRALVTLDLDFADIRTYPPGEHHGIVVLRPRTQAKPAVLQLLRQLIPLLSTEPLDGNLWILQENGVRIREGGMG
jgi:predicted nuclease of predicted toxin-antitoxin system